MILLTVSDHSCVRGITAKRKYLAIGIERNTTRHTYDRPVTLRQEGRLSIRVAVSGTLMIHRCILHGHCHMILILGQWAHSWIKCHTGRSTKKGDRQLSKYTEYLG